MHGLHILGGLVALGRDDRQGVDAAMARSERLRLERRAVRHVLAFPAVRLAGLFVLLAGWAADFIDICRQLLT